MKKIKNCNFERLVRIKYWRKLGFPLICIAYKFSDDNNCYHCFKHRLKTFNQCKRISKMFSK